MADYSHYPKALRPPSKKVKEKQRAQRQRVRSKARQAAARKKSKAEDKWGNIKQAVQDVRTSDAVALGATVLGRGRGAPKRPGKGKAFARGGEIQAPGTRAKMKRMIQAFKRRQTHSGPLTEARIAKAKEAYKKSRRGKEHKLKKKAPAKKRKAETRAEFEARALKDHRSFNEPRHSYELTQAKRAERRVKAEMDRSIQPGVSRVMKKRAKYKPNKKGAAQSRKKNPDYLRKRKSDEAESRSETWNEKNFRPLGRKQR